MAQSTPNMGLRQWNLATDYFESGNLSNNWSKVDLHDHTVGKGVQIPRDGIQNQAIDTSKLADGAVTGVKVGVGTLTRDRLAASPLLTSSPASPIDGQEIFRTAATGPPTVVWYFRYNAGSTSPYKWEFVGGPPMYAFKNDGGNRASASWGDPSTGPGATLTIPIAGDYRIEYGCVASAAGTMGLTHGSTTVAPDTSAIVASGQSTLFTFVPLLNQGAGTIYKTNFYGTFTPQPHYIRLLPSRVQ